MFDKISSESKEYNQLSFRARLRFDELNHAEFADIIYMLELRNVWG